MTISKSKQNHTTPSINHYQVRAQALEYFREKKIAPLLQHLTFVSHQNKIVFNEVLDELLSLLPIENENLHPRLQLFKSEQKLNEQNIEEAAHLIESIIQKTENSQNKEVLNLALLQKAVLNLFQNKQQESLHIFEACEVLTAQLNNTETSIQVAVYGYHFFSETNAQKAGEYIYRALALAEDNSNIYWQAYSLMHLGTLNTILNNNELALNFFEKSFALFQQLQLNLCMADNLMCRFNIYFRKKEFNAGIDCLEQAIELGTHCGWDNKIAICYGCLSFVHLQLKNYEAAKSYAEKDIQLSAKLNNQFNVGTAKYRLANIEAELGNYANAIELINESLEIRKNKITNAQRLQALQTLFGIYAKVGDFENAFRVQSDYMQLKFEIVDTEKAKETEALRAKYEAEKREAELREARLQQTESELKALKAQMNPHFIFNALNSIQEIFFLGDKRLANKHLARFSMLMRNILKASSRKTISLQEEIEMLQEYLALEALRFGSSFHYQITIDDAIDPYTLEIPPMIIQPFVENAVKHGLMHKNDNQQLLLNFSLNNHHCLTVTVTDNGIGRKASAEINKYRKKHESFSTSATEKRFEILNQNSNEKFSFHYHDLVDNNDHALGTEVVIIVPVSA